MKAPIHNTFRLVITKSATRKLVEMVVDSIKTHCQNESYTPPAVKLE